MSRKALAAIIAGMILLHQDFWFWDQARPLLFGFLPPGLWYHMAYSIAASVTLWALVKWAWPEDGEPRQ